LKCVALGTRVKLLSDSLLSGSLRSGSLRSGSLRSDSLCSGSLRSRPEIATNGLMALLLS
jgi:hypothetical protein